MTKVLKFKRTLNYYYNLIKQRQNSCDLWGVIDAIKNAKSLAKQKKDKNNLNFLLAQTYFEMGQYNLSLDYFFEVVEQKTLRCGAFFGIGRNLIYKNQYDLALDYFDACLKWDYFGVFSEPILEWTSYLKEKLDDVDCEHKRLVLSAKHFMMQKEFEKAKQILETLKSDAETLSLNSWCCFELEDFFGAKNLAKQALLEDENCVLAYFVLLKLCRKEKKQSLEKTYLNSLLNLEINNPISLRQAGLFLSSKKQSLRALAYFQKLCQVEEFNPKNHLFCGLCFYQLNQISEALLCVSKAIWLDEENPIYVFFYNAIKTGDLDKNENISAKLPKSMERQKVENLLNIFFGGKFSKVLDKSYGLLDDILWSFSLDDLNLTKTVSEGLVCSQNEKAICLFKKVLLKTFPTPKQKFLMIKEAIYCQTFSQICFVNNFFYSSFKLQKNELKCFSKNLKEGFANAVSFCECFYPRKMLIEKITKIARKNKNNFLLKNLSPKMIGCYFLKDQGEVFLDACLFFGVEKNYVENLKNCLEEQNEVSCEE